MNPDCRYCGFKDDKPHECFPKEARDVIDERTSWYHDQWQQAHDLQKLCEEQKRDYEEVCSVVRGMRERRDAVRDLVLDDVPHRYQKRLLEVLR